MEVYLVKLEEDKNISSSGKNLRTILSSYNYNLNTVFSAKYNGFNNMIEIKIPIKNKELETILRRHFTVFPYDGGVIWRSFFTNTRDRIGLRTFYIINNKQLEFDF